MLWRDLVGIDMGRTAALIAFVSFLKGKVIEGNQNGIGLGHLACVCYGKLSLVLVDFPLLQLLLGHW